MPRKKLEDLDATPAEEPKADAEVVVPASSSGATKKVKLDLEVDTSVKDLGPNPYAKVIHLAKAVDAWRIFPRIFISTYIYLLYRCVIWYMELPDPTLEQSGLISVVVGAGAAWFGLYAGTSKK
jgi:hypothetical protein|tara:strand:+ start:1042 stop:1413 length:372 start_codon:yes stop_codon:yes gene_type:complete